MFIIYNIIYLFWQAEERLAIIEEQRLMDEERQRMRKEQEKRVKEEQKVILGKNNSRPKLSFSLKPGTIWVVPLHIGHYPLSYLLTAFFSLFLYLNQTLCLRLKPIKRLSLL